MAVVITIPMDSGRDGLSTPSQPGVQRMRRSSDGPTSPEGNPQRPRSEEFIQEWTIRFNGDRYPSVATSEQGRLALL